MPRCAELSRPCAYCGVAFVPYSRIHAYCSDKCGKLHRHVRGGHPPRRVRDVGTCAWCGGRLTSADGHGRRYHLCCKGPALAARRWGAPEILPPPRPVPTTGPIVRAEGIEWEVVWDGREILTRVTVACLSSS